MSAPEAQQPQQQELSPENLIKLLEGELEKSEKMMEASKKQAEALKASIAKLKA